MRNALILIALWACFPSPGQAQGTLLFKTGFEANTALEAFGNGHRFTGRDAATGFSWDSNIVLGAMHFIYIAGDHPEKYVMTRLERVSGRDGKPTQALYMGVKQQFPGNPFGVVTRNEFSFFPGSPSFNEGYVCYWLKLQDNLLEIAPRTTGSRQQEYYHLDSWRMLMELKEPNSGISLKGRENNNYRISFFIARDPANNRMYWLLRGRNAAAGADH